MYKRTATILLCLFSVSVYSQPATSIPELLKTLEKTKDADKFPVYKQIGFLYLSQDKFDSALYYGNLSLKVCQKTGNEKCIGDSYNNIGLVYRIRGDHEKAVDMFYKALFIYEKNNLDNEISKVLANISFIYKAQYRYRDAITKLLQAAGMSEKAGDTLTLINLYGEIADNYCQIDSLGAAQLQIEKGRPLVTGLANKTVADPMDSVKLIYAKSFFNKVAATLYSRQRKFDAADKIYRQEWEDSRKYNTAGINKFDITGGWANNYYLAGKYDSALHYSAIALDLLKGSGIPAAYVKIYQMRADVFEKLGRYEEAYRAHVLFKQASDSENNDRTSKALSFAQTSYETEKKDLQILALNKTRRSQQLAIGLSIGAALFAVGFMGVIYRSKRLQKKLFAQREELLLKEKEMEMNGLQKRMNELEQMALRAQMNPHFIFNSLNSVQHFVMNKDVEGVNKYLGAFAHLVRQTLNNSGRPVISLDEEIKYLDTYLSLEKMKSNNSFDYHISVDEEIDQYSTFIPGMILQPFVENSIRHGVAYKENNAGEISISVSKNGKLVCRIEDNGIGREKAGEKKKTAVSPEFESKGMSITMSRIDMINKLYGADISAHVEDIVDGMGDVAGTRVTVDFPPDLE